MLGSEGLRGGRRETEVFNWLRAPYSWDFEEPKVGFLSDFPGALRLIVSSSYFGWAIIVLSLIHI